MCLSLLTILMCRVFAAALCVHLQGRAKDETQSSSSKKLSYEASRSALKFEAQRVHNKKKYIQSTRKFTYITSLVASTYALHCSALFSITLTPHCGAHPGASLSYRRQQSFHTIAQDSVLIIPDCQTSFQQNYPRALLSDLRFSGFEAYSVILFTLLDTPGKNLFFAMKTLAGLVSAPSLCTQLLSVLGARRLK